jgi:hypothetical protein
MSLHFANSMSDKYQFDRNYFEMIELFAVDMTAMKGTISPMHEHNHTSETIYLFKDKEKGVRSKDKNNQVVFLPVHKKSVDLL